MNTLFEIINLAFKYWFVTLILLLAYFAFIGIFLYEEYKRKGTVRGQKIHKKQNPVQGGDVFKVGNLSIPLTALVRHIFALGTSGAGKTTLFNEIIDNIIKYNKKAIIYDYTGDYIANFYDPDKDLILNAGDERSLNWTLANEINDEADLLSLAKSLIPEANNSNEKHWRDGARNIFIALFESLIKSKNATNANLYQILAQDPAEIYEALSSLGYPQAVNLAREGHAADIMSTLSEFTLFLKYAQDGNFSIKKWLADPDKRFIFVSNNPKIKEIQKPFLTLFIDFFAKTMLSMPKVENQEIRIFFLLDEFATLYRLDSIKDLLTAGRAKGVATLIGIQSVGDMDELYNENLRTSILNNCNNYCLLKTGDDKTTQVEANIIGTSEKWKKSVSSSHESYSENEQTQIDYVVLPSDFSKLEDFTGYFKILTKWYEFSLKKDKYVERPVVAEPFVSRKDLTY